VQHTFYAVLRILPFSLPTTNNFFKFVYSKITRESAWRVLFTPPWCCLLLWQLKVLRIGLTKILDFWYPGPSYLMQEVLVLYFFLYLVFCTQKMCWRKHSLADTVTLFLTIAQFSSELRKNWGTGLPCLCPLWIYQTGQQHKASLFPCLFPCLSSLCLQLLHHGSYLSFTQVLLFHTCTITSPFHRNTNFSFFRRLPSPSRSRGMPLLALTVPQTLTFLLAMSELTSHCYKNSLDRCEEKYVWKLLGQWTSRRSQSFTWTSCGNITVTVQTFTVTIIRDNKTCIRIQLTQNIVLLQNISMQSHDCNWSKTDSVSEWVVPLLQSNGSINRESRPVHLFVTWDPSILHQAVDNLQVKSEPDQLTNTCAGRRVRKHRNVWPINNAWDSNHAFLRGPTARC